jgi:SAM-dependent methyltransferase
MTESRRFRIAKRGFRRVWRSGGGKPAVPEGVAGVMMIGHRDYVGGRWDRMGRLQLDFLVGRGLRPDHVFLDIACGPLRGGVHFIQYLDPGNYLGIDKEKVLIRRGLAKELPRQVRREKRPELVVSDAFEFDRFSKRPHYSLAHSLFSHLNAADAERCLMNLRAHVAPEHQFYATFILGTSDENAGRSHARIAFRFSPDELAAIGARNGWLCDYIGDWDHPDNQVMMQFTAA